MIRSLMKQIIFLEFVNRSLANNPNYSANYLSHTGVLVGRISCLIFAAHCSFHPLVEQQCKGMILGRLSKMSEGIRQALKLLRENGMSKYHLVDH